MLWIFFCRNTPAEGSTGDTKIFQSRFDEGVDPFVDFILCAEVRVSLIEFKKPWNEFLNIEELGFFRIPVNGTMAVWTEVVAFFVDNDLAIRPEGLIWSAIPAFVFTKIDIAFF